jgi:Ca2+-binding EF-hand superfamily protein
LFAFDLYDKDGTGELSVEELEQMIKDIYGKNYETNPNARM